MSLELERPRRDFRPPRGGMAPPRSPTAQSAAVIGEDMNASPFSQTDHVPIGTHRRQFEAPTVTYRLLGSKGLRPTEAGNLTAYLHGLSPVESGWNVGEIERLLFVRHLVMRGDIGS
jgi:hypothetical protein